MSNGKLPLASYPQEERFQTHYEWFVRGAIALNFPITSEAEKRRMVFALLESDPGKAIVQQAMRANGCKFERQENGRFDIAEGLYAATFALIDLLFG